MTDLIQPDRDFVDRVNEKLRKPGVNQIWVRLQDGGMIFANGVDWFEVRAPGYQGPPSVRFFWDGHVVANIPLGRIKDAARAKH